MAHNFPSPFLDRQQPGRHVQPERHPFQRSESLDPRQQRAQYAGDATRWNPEDLLGSALATCHMLTFLALCAKAKVEVVGYEDHAESVLDTVDKVTRITQVRLRPLIRVTPAPAWPRSLSCSKRPTSTASWPIRSPAKP